MKNLCLAAILAAIASPLSAQAATSPTSLKPAVDTPQQREALRKLSICLAKQRPRWARAMLSRPYLSFAQASVAAEAISGEDTCLRVPEAEFTFRTSTIVGALAEYYVRSDIGKLDMPRVSGALATTVPLNSSEDFALCVTSRNPKAAVEFMQSDPGSTAEATAAGALADHVGSCTQPGELLDVDMQALRSLVATALYRGLITALGQPG